MKDTIDDFLKHLKIEEGSSYKCGKCRDTGYLIRKGLAVPCTCGKAKKGLPPKLEKIYLKDFNLKYYPKELINPERGKESYHDKAQSLLSAAMDFIQGVVERRKNLKGLFITGPIGSGKTHLVSGIYNELKRLDQEVLFFVVPDLMEQAKADMFGEGAGRDVFAKAKKAKILILDDLGAHNYTPWVINQLYTLFNYRMNNNLITIITTNLTLEEIDYKLDERIASRILEICDSYSLNVDVDIRYKKNIRKK